MSQPQAVNSRGLKRKSMLAVATLAAVLSFGAQAKEMTLNSEVSQVNFVSVKNNAIAEVHALPKMTGDIDQAGNVSLSIDLKAINSGIEIRDTRMQKSLFEVTSFPIAQINSKIDPQIIDDLKAGESKRVTLTLDVNLHGKQKLVQAPLQLIARVDGSIAVNTVQPLIINAQDFGLETGVGTLQALAKLDAIATSVPVTAQLVFDAK